jgi:Zn-dependent protease
MIVVNVTLALFNLLPIPPLDGSRVLAAVLPRRLGYSIYSPRVQTVGMAVLYLLLSVGGGRFLGPAVVQTAVWIGRLTVFTSLP